MVRKLFFLLIFIMILASCNENGRNFGEIILDIEQQNPFHHKLDIQYSKGKTQNIILCSHGFGGNAREVLERIRPYVQDNLISFNFIDHDISHATGGEGKTVMATPLEIMPLIYVLKQLIVEHKIEEISLYGYALGGGNIISALHFLTREESSQMLNDYIITKEEKKQILSAVRRGRIVLDVPFKSLDEIISFQGINPTLSMYKERMNQYKMLNPIDSLLQLKNLNMTFLVFFDVNNTALSNRDDSLFIKRLLDANPLGRNVMITDDNGGHLVSHPTLWKVYSVLDKF